MNLDIDKKNFLPYLLAYSGFYFAFDGLSQDDANAWSQIGKIVPEEEEAILNGINKLLNLTNEDLDENGIVNMDDTKSLVDIAFHDYNLDVKKKVNDSNKAIQNLSLLVEKVARLKEDSPLVVDFCYNYLKEVKRASNRNDEQNNKLINIVHKAWYED